MARLPSAWTDPVLLADARSALLAAARGVPLGGAVTVLDATTPLTDDAAYALAALDLVGWREDEPVALLRVEAVRPWTDAGPLRLLVSDLLPEPPLPADHVPGAGGAADTLAAITVPLPEGCTVLDLGTGSGVQTLHRAAAGQQVTATDIHDRALDLAARSLALSGLDAELLQGDTFAPVAGRRFDLVVSNPPMVLSPSADLVHRAVAGPAESFCRRLVAQASGHLVDGGWCQLLAHWVVPAGVPWEEHVAGWLPPDCDAFVVQRDVLAVEEYVRVWAQDGGRGGDTAYRDTWARWLEAAGATAVGLGWITLRRAAGSGRVRLEEVLGAVPRPGGPWIRDVVEGLAGPGGSAGAAGSDGPPV